MPRTGALAPAAGPVVAVIDIGSNSGRVMVYRSEPGGHLHALAGSRAPLRLVRDLERTGRIPDEALERCLAALREFRAIARGAGARRIVAAGTSALRDAANGPAFVRRVRRELGLEILVLSGLEEARHGFLGAVAGLPVDDGVLFDLGGGSLQLAQFRARRLLAATSLPLGALRVSDRFLRSDPPSPRELRRLRDHARRLLEEAGVRPLGRADALVGTGGTLRNLAKVDQRLAGYPVPRLHGYVLGRRRLHELAARLAGERAKKRARLPGLNSDRRDSVVGGALVIEALAEALGAEAVLVSGEGVREGLARSVSGDSVGPSAEARRSSLDALAARFAGWSRERAERREALAASLLEALERPPSAEMAETLRHAARVVDVGRTVDFFDRHEHAADLVLATDLGGFSHRGVALLSAVLRQAGDEEARPRSLEPLVGRADRDAIERAAVVLALAEAITDRCLPGSPARLSLRLRGKEAVLRVPALEAWGARGLDERFRAAFGRTLRVVPGKRPVTARASASARSARASRGRGRSDPPSGATRAAGAGGAGGGTASRP
jgi:exopolyphosphatase/guanosine-5'-triphosphate,3'-diphosphate pyrophosphatase